MIYYYPYQLYVLGLKNLDRTRFLENTYPEFTNKAIIMSTIGVLAFKIGFNLYSSNNKVYVIYKVSKKYINALSYITLFLISFILVLFINTGMITLFC